MIKTAVPAELVEQPPARELRRDNALKLFPFHLHKNPVIEHPGTMENALERRMEFFDPADQPPHIFRVGNIRL